MNASLLNKLENLGYYALPPRHEHCLGHTGLLILMRHQSSVEPVAFDPQTIHLRLLDWNGKAHWSTFKVTTPFPMSRVICPGPIAIQGRSGQRATFFVFGGSLEARDENANEKVYSLRSSAPVLELTSEKSTTADQLTAEVEALWARLQISWNLDDEAFWRQLTKIDSFRLFVATIQTVLDHDKQIPDLHTSQQRQALHHALQQEKSWLQETGRWPEPAPSLAEFGQQIIN